MVGECRMFFFNALKRYLECPFFCYLATYKMLYSAKQYFEVGL